jgi:hypothetical protein
MPRPTVKEFPFSHRVSNFLFHNSLSSRLVDPVLDENVIRKHDITSQMNLKELLAQEAENRNPNR